MPSCSTSASAAERGRLSDLPPPPLARVVGRSRHLLPPSRVDRRGELQDDREVLAPEPLLQVLPLPRQVIAAPLGGPAAQAGDQEDVRPDVGHSPPPDHPVVRLLLVLFPGQLVGG